MKKLRGALSAKITAWILAGVSVLGLAAGLLAIAVLLEAEVYTVPKESLIEEAFSRYSDRYSAIALAQMEAGTNQDFFANKNFRYGIIKAESIEELQNMDLNAGNIYVERNFTEEIDLKDMQVFEFEMNEAVEIYSYRPDSLWGYYWITHAYDAGGRQQIHNFVLDQSSGIIYSETEDCYYPVRYVCFEAEVWDQTDEMNKKIKLYYRLDEDRQVYVREDLRETVYYENERAADAALPSSEALIVTEEISDTGNDWILHIFCRSLNIEAENYDIYRQVQDILTQETMTFSDLEGTAFERGSWENYVEIFYGNSTDYFGGGIGIVDLRMAEGKTVEQGDDYWMNDDMILYDTDGNGDTYFVISFVHQPLTESGKWETEDLYVKSFHLIELMYHMRYFVIWLSAVFLFLLLASVSFLLYSAGCRKGTEKIAVKWVNKIPLEISTGVVFILEMIIGCFAYEIGVSYNGRLYVLWLIGFLFFVLCGFYLLLAYGMDVSVRVKKGKWWRTTILYQCFCFAVRAGRFFQHHISLLWKLVLGFGVLSFGELIIILIMYGSGLFGFFLWVVLKAAVLALLLKCAAEMLRLKEAGEHIAAGDLQYQADTSKMMFDFKQHGENLNSVNVGLSKAVEAKIRSERFKTELITNVSHDIKTPLTSIINYVDLLKKEGTENKTVQEYIEVLDRQSSRLKKLIEDLMEASKASTGNLEVALEKLEAGVFMVQTVGEFEEKVEKSNLELIIKKPEEPVYIMADGRHFWRVIDNLMSNICKYAQPQTRVYIDLDVKEGKAVLIFRNTSRYPLNISSDELMERFVRGDSSRNTEGNGLGLSIAGSLMELMHGQFKLTVDGDLFKVILMFDVVENEMHVH